MTEREKLRTIEWRNVGKQSSVCELPINVRWWSVFTAAEVRVMRGEMAWAVSSHVIFIATEASDGGGSERSHIVTGTWCCCNLLKSCLRGYWGRQRMGHEDVGDWLIKVSTSLNEAVFAKYSLPLNYYTSLRSAFWQSITHIRAYAVQLLYTVAASSGSRPMPLGYSPHAAVILSTE